MSRNIKLIPISPNTFVDFHQHTPQQPPVEILAPKSYEYSSESSAIVNTGLLGNTLVSGRFFQAREYSFNWVGKKKEIDKIRLYLTQTSNRFFLFAGLSDNPVVTPSVMYDSKAMLASLVDQHKPLNSSYENYLPEYGFTESPRRGSTGVQLSDGNVPKREQFDIIPANSVGASAYIYLEKGVEYSWAIDQNLPSNGVNCHTVPFSAIVVSLDNSTSGGVIKYLHMDNNDANTYSILTEALDHDAVALLTVVAPTDSEGKNNSSLHGILNYSAPIITSTSNFDSWHKLDLAMANSLEDVPSLLTPVNAGVYNMLSSSLAEFSISFQEIVYEIPR